MDAYVFYALCLAGICIGCLVAGYALARLDGIYFLLQQWHDAGLPGGITNQQVSTPAQAGFFNKKHDRPDSPTTAAGKIDIDSRTVVTQINTAGLQRASAAEMGKTTQTADEIDKSVSRLSQLKGK